MRWIDWIAREDEMEDAVWGMLGLWYDRDNLHDLTDDQKKRYWELRRKERAPRADFEFDLSYLTGLEPYPLGTTTRTATDPILKRFFIAKYGTEEGMEDYKALREGPGREWNR